MYSAIAANKRRTWIIMAVFVALVGGLGYAVSTFIFGQPYMTVAVIVGAIAYTVFMYFGASKMAIASHGAKEITSKSEPRLYRTVENLAITNGMPMPKVYVVEDAALNAFATGRDPDHAVVAATRGLLDAMDNQELEGVMAHELGHVKNYDIRVSLIAMGLAMVVAFIADMTLRGTIWGRGSREGGRNMLLIVASILASLLAPLLAKLIQSAVSRQREYLADATGVETTRNPEGLARALTKLGGGNSTMKKQNSATAHLFISNPLNMRSMTKAFSTHPPIEDRVARLHNMGDRL